MRCCCFVVAPTRHGTAATVDMIPAVMTDVVRLLKHDRELVRKKAAMVLHRMNQLDPDVRVAHGNGIAVVLVVCGVVGVSGGDSGGCSFVVVAVVVPAAAAAAAAGGDDGDSSGVVVASAFTAGTCRLMTNPKTPILCPDTKRSLRFSSSGM